jgi:hypothetical protein
LHYKRQTTRNICIMNLRLTRIETNRRHRPTRNRESRQEESKVPASWKFDDYDDGPRDESLTFGRDRHSEPLSGPSHEYFDHGSESNGVNVEPFIHELHEPADNLNSDAPFAENENSNHDGSETGDDMPDRGDIDKYAVHNGLDMSDQIPDDGDFDAIRGDDDSIDSFDMPSNAVLKRQHRTVKKRDQFDTIVSKLLKFDLLNKRKRRIMVRKNNQSIVCRDRNNLKLFEIRVLTHPEQVHVSLFYMQKRHDLNCLLIRVTITLAKHH